MYYNYIISTLSLHYLYIISTEEDDPRVGGQWRIATLSRRGKRSPAAVIISTLSLHYLYMWRMIGKVTNSVLQRFFYKMLHWIHRIVLLSL
jgi:hypothetical protein